MGDAVSRGASIFEWLPLASVIVVGVVVICATTIVIRRRIRGEAFGALGWTVVVFWGLTVMSTAAKIMEINKSPEQRAFEQKRRNAPTFSPYVVETVVKRQLRDPDSAIFGKMDVYADRKLDGKQVTVVCGTVNAKNGFGGYTGDALVLFVEEMSLALVDTPAHTGRFGSVWNALCAGKHTR